MVKKILQESHALLHGHFALTSGKHSEYYIEKIRLIHNPIYVEQLCSLLADKLHEYDNEIIVGPAYGGIVLAYEIAKKLGKKFIFTQRKEEQMIIRSGFTLTKKTRAIIIEDIVTTGGSVKEVISALEENNISVQAIGCIVDRSGGCVNFGYDFIPLLTMDIKTYNVTECPLCLLELPLTKPGASDKLKI